MSGILSDNSLQNSGESPSRSTNNPATSISVNKEEVDKFNGVQWWDEEKGTMKPLISMNKLRYMLPSTRTRCFKYTIVEQSYQNFQTIFLMHAYFT